MKFYLIKNKLSAKSVHKIFSILKSENRSSLLANFSYKNVEKYLNIVAQENSMELYAILNPNVIGYAILAKKPKYLVENFLKLKIVFLFDLLVKLKFLTLIDIFISMINADIIFVKARNKKIIKNSLNLYLLGIEKKYQGQRIGNKFLKFIIKKTRFKSKYITCETDNDRAIKFYKKKLSFKIIGLKIRILKRQNILSKKIY